MTAKIFITTFWAIFAAELADKTQFVGMAMAAETERPAIVWLGSVSAYMVITLLSVIAGALLAKFLKPELIRYLSGSIFMVIGLLILFDKM